MSRFAILALCVQACLIQAAVSCNCGGGQSAYSQQLSYQLPVIEQYSCQLPAIEQISYQVPSYSCVEQVSYQPLQSVSVSAPAVVSTSSVSQSRTSYGGSYGGAYGGSYGGSGYGEVGVSGDILASGQTAVVGSVPVMGCSEFAGIVPASGSVSISGQCGCGCY